MHLWKYSGPKLMPMGRMLKQNWPNGVINVVSSLHSFASGSCQKPDHASSLVKIVTPFNWANDCSTEDKIWRSLHTASFNLAKSTHIQIFPFYFTTGTIPAHHSIGCSILDITPILSIRSNSSLILFSKGISTLRGIVSAYGTASAFKRILEISF